MCPLANEACTYKLQNTFFQGGIVSPIKFLYNVGDRISLECRHGMIAVSMNRFPPFFLFCFSSTLLFNIFPQLPRLARPPQSAPRGGSGLAICPLVLTTGSRWIATRTRTITTTMTTTTTTTTATKAMPIIAATQEKNDLLPA